MKIILLIFTVLLPCKTNTQSTQDSSLYSNIKYVNGKYEREIECVFQGIGKNPIDGDTQGIASAIKKEIKEIPKSSVSLVYKEKEYYISIKNKCHTRGIPYGEKIKIRIIYFEKLRQPYDFTYPFAIITKIEVTGKAPQAKPVINPITLPQNSTELRINPLSPSNND